MPHSFGYRARTRSMFSRDFRKKGVIPLSNYLRVYKLGDFVDIKANAAIHKGMPHKYYHGRTGRIFDLTKTSVGVEVNKVVRNRQLKKRIHIRVEHVRPSKCRQEFLNRRAENEKHKKLVRAGQAGAFCASVRPSGGGIMLTRPTRAPACACAPAACRVCSPQAAEAPAGSAPPRLHPEGAHHPRAAAPSAVRDSGVSRGVLVLSRLCTEAGWSIYTVIQCA